MRNTTQNVSLNMLGMMTQSGGKLLDKGMYGCIFTDFLSCKREKGNPSKLHISTPMKDPIHPPLTKLTHVIDAEQEFAISEVIRRIPNWNRYFAVAESMCTPSLKQKDKDITKCDALKQFSLSESRILSMTYYGVPLYRYKFNVKEVKLRDFFIHMIESCAMLTLFGIIHRDIHQGNMLVDQYNVPRLIDFNLALFYHNTEADMITHVHNVSIFQEPPDSTIVNAIHKGYNAEKVIDSIISKKPGLNKISSILGVSKDDMKLDLRRFVQVSRSVQKGDLMEWFQSYWRTIDSWAIGINIVECISTFILWPEWESQINDLRPTFFPVLEKMCAVNPIERIDCIQALHAIDPQNFIVRTYGKAWMDKVGSMN